MTDTVPLLSKITLSRTEEVAILFNFQKPTQKVQENEEREEYALNKQTQEYKRKIQKQILIKWR